MTVQFRHIMLMVPDVMAAVKFYSEGLGLAVKTASPGWGELETGGTILALHYAENPHPAGASPILSFVVDDLAATVASLEALGARLEGRVREPSFGKVAAMRTPDGHLLSLLQPAPVGAAVGSGAH
ncbi:VOC family protein [Gloeobacter morelensis]|uniref:VOC family protein n=1 Tax=Gloeobacter morelensis MG652769 TaxID=2781736 RepID=A0ABY3PND6_9CYAN|nr:VOC family protein [Gloeobacter morelensis]UFP95218.1 VOC family protein [Gloeobacter morelensis MG652769]